MNFDVLLYQNTPQIVLGFHGCDKKVARRILASGSKHLRFSRNEYDWLGNGIYFWLNDPRRAYEWAEQVHERDPKKVSEPYVIGAVIDLGHCLNLCERESVLLLQNSYASLKNSMELTGLDIDQKYRNTVSDPGGFKLLRSLDCAVIENLHNDFDEHEPFDTVYGYFQEGTPAYEGAGILEKTHIQICVRNTDCIKGYFLPRIRI